MRYWRSCSFGVAGCASALLAVSLAADINIDTAKSTIVATYRQDSVPLDAPFKSFSGAVNYDPRKVESSSVYLEVETASINIGDEDYNAVVREKSWLDSADFPKATFMSTDVKPGTGDQLRATGVLTIKGTARVITIPISVKASGGFGSFAFDGSFDISRAAYGIGDKQWDDVLDDKISIRFHLVDADERSRGQL